MKYLILFLPIWLFSCTQSVETGVSRKLAKQRKEIIKELEYKLLFNIPDSLSQPCNGEVEVIFSLNKNEKILLDYKAPVENIQSVEVNGEVSDYEFTNEHIIVSGEKGINIVKIKFTVSDHSLNRRDEFLYTLLVPDRARTLFPCFDQPDLKANFTLSLKLPEGWKGVSNGKLIGSENKVLTFEKTEPLSTYLFSIVAGELEAVSDGDITLYHRETDPVKIAQTTDILKEVRSSLEWLEEYTDVDYPFAKYDLIILPGFQYGGMEHTGATLYNDRLMFLNPSPTINERLARTSLIAHETAHMWFGDYVTMEWFSDVWTKEVFANYFASQIVAPQFPEVNHALNFMLSYAPSSYSEDRTTGSNPIQQELDNLQDAGLVYGNIIYNKSPMVMNMLVEMVGAEKFQQGIREYLTTYAYGNATWDKLITILDCLSEVDLQTWSDVWIKEKGMPTISVTTNYITQNDPLGRGFVWKQPLALLHDTTIYNIISDRDTTQNPAKATPIIPNCDGQSYGFFKLDLITATYCMAHLSEIKDDVTRGSVVITLYENFLNKSINATEYLDCMISYLPKETNQLIFSQAVSYAKSCFHLVGEENKRLEDTLWNIESVTALRAYSDIVRSATGVSRLYELWRGGTLTESDAINISYQLAVLMPERSQEITTEQLARITNSDRRKQYQFISPAVSSSQSVRDSVFSQLLLAENRTIEPWAETALSLLNHPLRQKEAVKYIRPALDKLQEIQKTGDIFFPTKWCKGLLGGHRSEEALIVVNTFFSENKNYPEKLLNKIKQNLFTLYLEIKK